MPDKKHINPPPHHRLSIRLRGFDYTQAGAYFITLCTHARHCLFGDIMAAAHLKPAYMILNIYGNIIRDEWLKTGALRPNVLLDEWIIMPNHFHAIINLKHRANTLSSSSYEAGEHFGKPSQASIPTLVRAFKSASTRAINTCRGTPGLPVWQRNYWEHVIRDEQSYIQLAQYIINNPTHWETDQLYPVIKNEGTTGG